jgi:hypothetical protein
MDCCRLYRTQLSYIHKHYTYYCYGFSANVTTPYL